MIGLAGGAVGPTLAPLAAQTGVSLSVIGILLTARSIGYLAGSIASRQGFDRIDGHRGLGTALLLAAAGMALIPAVGSLTLLVLVMLFFGVALSVLDVGANTMVFRTYRSHAAPYLNALHFSYGFGGLVAPFVVAALATPAAPIAWAYRTLAAFALPFALVLFTAPAGRLPVAKDEASRRRRERLPLLAALLTFLYVGAETALTSWLFIFVLRSADGTVATSAVGAFWGAFSLFRFVGILVARKLAPERILWVNLGGGVLFFLPLILIPEAPWALWIGVIGVGAAIASTYPNLVSLFGRRQPLSGRELGTMSISSCLGTMTFPWLIGQLLVVAGRSAVPITCAGLLVAALGLLGLYLARQRPKPVETTS
jgi:FHS family Na+ dependent glucose MFS transporter 1